ncbi:hypothetical protein [Streptomyces sp. NPDC048636]|uniref:hypothetical protein n=1 Tax=Streptomyces sp. NPDC048636 TaxID=3155762 RepID=UPI00343F97BF
MPDLAPYAQSTARLHPRRGLPGIRESHIGGPLWWPADEPWPDCAEHKDINGTPQGPYPLVAVAQLTAADFPEAPFPAGTDLVQLLWCPDWHDQPHPEGWGQACQLVWRRASDITEPLVGQPDPEDHWAYDEDMLPRPCVLRPERAVEYPWVEELPDALRERLDEDHYRENSVLTGCKLGGSMGWATTDMPSSLECGVCGQPLALFLQFDTYEDDADGEDREPTGMTVGRGSHAGLFVCSGDPTHPPSFFTQ